MYPKTIIGKGIFAGVAVLLGAIVGLFFPLMSLLQGVVPFLILALIGVLLPEGMEKIERYVDLAIVFFAMYFLVQLL